MNREPGFKKQIKQHLTPLPYLTKIVCVYVLMCRLCVPLLNVCSSVLELLLSINVLYYVMFHVLCGPQEE